MNVTGRILLGAGIVAGLILIAPFALLASGAYKTFHIPAESMRPTLDVGDMIVARMSPPAVLDRGDIVLVNNGGSIYIKRVAGHFRGKLVHWDVVNEALWLPDRKPMGLRDGAWLRAVLARFTLPGPA